MFSFIKYLGNVGVVVLAYLSPIKPLVICALVFIGIDFMTGVIASWKRARNAGQPWAFESARAWRTIMKLIFVMVGICMAWMIDKDLLDFASLNLAKLFTGFICAVEFWSYLENAAEISDHPVFRSLRRFMKDRLKEQGGIHTDQQP